MKNEITPSLMLAVHFSTLIMTKNGLMKLRGKFVELLVQLEPTMYRKYVTTGPNLSCTRQRLRCLPNCRHIKCLRHVATCLRRVARHVATCYNVSVANLPTYETPTSRHVGDRSPTCRDILPTCRDMSPTCRDMSAICRKCATNMSWSN